MELHRLLRIHLPHTLEGGSMTTHMFPRGDDLPLFSGSVYGPTQPPVFVPEVTATQDSLLDLRPVLGSAEPTYQPKPHTQENEK